MLSVAGHDRANDDRVNAGSLKRLELIHAGDVIASEQIARVLEQAATDEVLVDLALLVVQRVGNALGRAAVDLANDNVLRDVDQTTGQVTRVSRTQSGVGHALTSAVRGDEVLQNRKALAEVRLNRAVDGATLGVAHEAAHTSQLANLLDVTTSTRVGHHVNGVVLVEVGSHGLADFLGGVVPNVNDLLMALFGAHEAHLVVLVDGRDLLALFGGMVASKTDTVMPALVA